LNSEQQKKPYQRYIVFIQITLQEIKIGEGESTVRMLNIVKNILKKYLQEKIKKEKLNQSVEPNQVLSNIFIVHRFHFRWCHAAVSGASTRSALVSFTCVQQN